MLGKEGAKEEVKGKDEIQGEIDNATAFQARFRRYEAEILQEDGVREKLARSNVITAQVEGVIRSLEDILCQAMIGCISFEAKYTARQLMYQE